MLSQLTIKNFGLIDQLSIEFHNKLNILTGETGAGKSIVIGALRAALGGKLNVSQLRLSDQPCAIEAVFDLNTLDQQIKDFLSEYLDDDDATLVIRRVLTPEGRHKIKINGQSVNIGELKDIGKRLIDFHGAHDHQMLLSSDTHIRLLDQLCSFEGLLDQYKQVFDRYCEIKHKINELQSLSQNRDRELDLLEHQIKELDQVRLDMDHYVEVEQKKIKMDSVEKLSELLNNMIQSLDGDEQSSGEMIRRCFSPMKQLVHLDEHSSELDEQLNALQDVHDSLLMSLREYSNGLSFDEEEAYTVYQQSDAYYTILRKYGPDITDAAKFYEEAKNKYESLINLEDNDAGLRKQLKKYQEQLKELAEGITKERKKRAKHLSQTIEKELKCLGIAHVVFEVQFCKREFDVNGVDQVEFYISPNAGESLKPLAEIVSSGEAARVMLALKKALIEVDPIPVLVFDEIDAQIGGRLGTITGQKLKDIAQYRQVLLITHLPQIASFADIHLKVTKFVKDSRSVTQVIALTSKERVIEVAQMMSGYNESAVSIKHAQDMLAVAGS